MKAKTIMTRLLLVFVAVCAAYFVIGESRIPCCTLSTSSTAASGSAATAGQPAAQPATTASDAPPESEAAVPAHKVIAYYFHGTQRCKTCRAIERLAQETVTAQFADDLASGALEWHSINVDDPAHEHFVTDYSLVTSSLVLVDVRDGDAPVWVNLDRVWQLVHDEPAFKGYLVTELLAYLEPGT